MGGTPTTRAGAGHVLLGTGLLRWKNALLLVVARSPGTLPATAGCQVMKTQLDVLRSRDSSSIARGLTWPSHGLGLPIALQAWRV